VLHPLLTLPVCNNRCDVCGHVAGADEQWSWIRDFGCSKCVGPEWLERAAKIAHQRTEAMDSYERAMDRCEDARSLIRELVWITDNHGDLTKLVGQARKAIVEWDEEHRPKS
jgi:hypothetical protein